LLLLKLPEVAGFQVSPVDATAYYDDNVSPILFGVGGYPVFLGAMQGTLQGTASSSNLMAFDPAVDNWNSVLIIRYPLSEPCGFL